MDRSAGEPMDRLQHEEWLRFQAWQRHRHSDRHAVAAAQTPPEVPGTSNCRRALVVTGLVLAAVLATLALSAVDDTIAGGDGIRPASAEFGARPWDTAEVRHGPG
ncbi:hypothetical protein GCM10009613_24700 [Pseudonocardia kongjuensis]|uniref:Uncharacterized protein n=1 Tax=Pseudonocardia kongjuensis TaxID=102227 RepID=A0ABN1XR30_9PSEU